MTPESPPELLSYGTYLRVSELLELQSPVGQPAVHDEMLFIILQQAQELWFKQILHDLRAVISGLRLADTVEPVHLLGRINRILRVLGEEVEVMETLSPTQFARFRGLLKPSSGFESRQFRELEYASGLRDDAFMLLIERVVNPDELAAQWPVSLHQAFLEILRGVDADPVAALLQIYERPTAHVLYALCEACSEYEMRFLEWRFHHVSLVERVIGSGSPGTGGSSGTGYLAGTLRYRFFPELWEVRKRISDRSMGNWDSMSSD